MKKEMMLIIGMIAILAMVPSACADAIITDHIYTNLSEIPDEWVGEAKDNPPCLPAHIPRQPVNHRHEVSRKSDGIFAELPM